jgi:hypothetical protein
MLGGVECVDSWVEGTNKIEVSSGFVSSGALSSAEEGPRGLPLVKRPIMYGNVGVWVGELPAGDGASSDICGAFESRCYGQRHRWRKRDKM